MTPSGHMDFLFLIDFKISLRTSSSKMISHSTSAPSPLSSFYLKRHLMSIACWQLIFNLKQACWYLLLPLIACICIQKLSWFCWNHSSVELVNGLRSTDLTDSGVKIFVVRLSVSFYPDYLQFLVSEMFKVLVFTCFPSDSLDRNI